MQQPLLLFVDSQNHKHFFDEKKNCNEEIGGK